MAILNRQTASFFAKTLALIGAFATILAQSPTGLAQTPYTYTLIESLNSGGSYPPSINNSGQVAFITTNGTVYRGDGSEPTLLASANIDEGMPHGYASINASGAVAFATVGVVFFPRIMVADGVGPAATLASGGPTWEGVLDPSINDVGQVVFSARFTSTQAYSVVMGSAFTPIASPGDTVTAATLTGAYGPKINNNGVVGFTATVTSGPIGIFRTTNGPLMSMGIASATGTRTFGMNDAGIVAFWNQQNIVTSDGVTETIIAEASAGFRPEPHLAAINSAGMVAFLASDGLGGPNSVFVGDGTLLPRPVLEAGKSIPDLGTVLNTSISNDAINDRGQVAIVVTYEDAMGAMKTAIVRANPGNAAPVAGDADVAMNEDEALNGTLPASDANGDPLTFSIVTTGVLGSAVITDSAAGSYTYTPNADANGTDTLTFVARDGAVNSNVGTITVTIVPVNDAPVAQDGVASTFIVTPVNGTLAATDIDSPSLTYSVVTNGAKGTAVIANTTTGAYTYTPATGQSGLDTFTFRASDGSLNSNAGTVTVSIAANRPPVAVNGSLATREDRAATGSLIATDADGNPVTFAIVSNGSLGTATITNPSRGRYTYVPLPNAHGTDTFTFRAGDGTTLSNIATVTITITSVNDAPVAVNGAVVTTLNTPVTSTLVATDVDGDTLTFTVSGAPRRGTLVVAGNGTFTYTPRAGFVGTDTFTFRAHDGTATSARATVTVTVQ